MTEKEQKIRELYMKYETIRNEVNTLATERELIEKKIEEMNLTMEALNEITKMKDGDKILSSLGSGIFVETKVDSINQLIVNIGAKVLKKMKIEETKRYLTNKKRNLEGALQEINKRIVEYLQVLKLLEDKINEVSEKE